MIDKESGAIQLDAPDGAWPLVANISATARRCDAENIGISYGTLREWVNNGTIPHVLVGRSRFINWDVLMRFLEIGQKPSPATSLPKRVRGRYGYVR